MAFKLRTYQQEAVEAAISWIKKSTEPCLLDLATGAGKSLIVAAIARWLNQATGKSVLCLAPSKELVEQNHAKYQAYGEKAGFYSASVGKSLRYPVVFGTPVSVKNDILRFKGGNFSLVIIDECHQITPTIKEIIEHLREANPNLRVIGLTATPYRMGEGYIYRYQADGTPLPLEAAACPYFNTCVYSIGTRDLIKMGFLVPVYTDPDQVKGYDASSLKLRGGRFKQAEVDKVFVGRGRLTSDIVADVVSKSAGKNGVIFFAANVQHAEEIAECLPRELTGIITSKTKKDVRAKIIKDFCAMRIKYLINVAVLTTGFDAPHVDVIALLRLSESASLIQQIIGRGLRLSPETGKDHCLFLDYAGNIERHGLEGDLFAPKIQARAASAGELIDVVCPLCSRANSFKARPNKEGYHLGQDGYFYLLDSDNPSPVLNEDGKPIPSHFGRKCLHQWPDKSNPGKFVDCSYRWAGKECDECGHESDIAARFCENCRAELVDPNEKLRLEHSQAVSDPFSPMTYKVNFFDAKRWVAKSGKIMLKCDYVTDTIRIGLWYCPEFSKPWKDLCLACFGKHIETVDDFLLAMMTDSEYQAPKTLTAYKNKASGYYRVLAHNMDIPQELENAS